MGIPDDPLYITLETALLAGIDHANNQWKSLCARPVPRWTFYVAKLIVALVMNMTSSVLLALGIIASGLILPHLHTEPRMILAPPIPWLRIFHDTMMMMGLALVALTIQHWISLRWRSFSIAIGAGIVAITPQERRSVVGHSISWAMPMLVQSPRSPNLDFILVVGTGSVSVIVAAGCWDFSRREIQ